MKAAEVKDIKNKKEVTGNGNLSVTDILSKMSHDNEFFKKKIKEITSGDNSLGPGQMDIEKVVELYAKSSQNTSSKKAEDVYLKSVQNIVFQAKECKHLTASDADIEGMVKELLDERIIG